MAKPILSMATEDVNPPIPSPMETRNLVVDLYRNKYYDANFEHFTELLGKHEDIYISPSVMSILEAEYILSPKATKAKKRESRTIKSR